MITTQQQKQAEEYGRNTRWSNAGFVVGNGRDPLACPIQPMGVTQKERQQITQEPFGLLSYGIPTQLVGISGDNVVYATASMGRFGVIEARKQ